MSVPAGDGGADQFFPAHRPRDALRIVPAHSDGVEAELPGSGYRLSVPDMTPTPSA
ncbi:hypothetical protein JOF55_000990 [Haloactinomyces albus]|uniref:Uncharacterized protein n=1 Tax=Haloactinomyces albus TaxID=1352928 RepID=A0AAE3ZCY4_9ACTN|nr:hypothetical protein [Haloactinomyces albus]